MEWKWDFLSCCWNEHEERLLQAGRQSLWNSREQVSDIQSSQVTGVKTQEQVFVGAHFFWRQRFGIIFMLQVLYEKNQNNKQIISFLGVLMWLVALIDNSGYCIKLNYTLAPI